MIQHDAIVGHLFFLNSAVLALVNLRLNFTCFDMRFQITWLLLLFYSEKYDTLVVFLCFNKNK